jgi:hypothetical protein
MNWFREAPASFVVAAAEVLTDLFTNQWLTRTMSVLRYEILFPNNDRIGEGQVTATARRQIELLKNPLFPHDRFLGWDIGGRLNYNLDSS